MRAKPPCSSTMVSSHKTARPKQNVGTEKHCFLSRYKDTTMSFLLRNRSSTNGAGRVLPSIQAPKPNPSSRPRPISSHNDDTSNGSSVHGIRSGNQLQLQRTVKPPQLQPQAQKGSHQDHNRLHHLDVASQGVISMSEGTSNWSCCRSC